MEIVRIILPALRAPVAAYMHRLLSGGESSKDKLLARFKSWSLELCCLSEPVS